MFCDRIILLNSFSMQPSSFHEIFDMLYPNIMRKSFLVLLVNILIIVIYAMYLFTSSLRCNLIVLMIISTFLAILLFSNYMYC